MNYIPKALANDLSLLHGTDLYQIDLCSSQSRFSKLQHAHASLSDDKVWLSIYLYNTGNKKKKKERKRRWKKKVPTSFKSFTQWPIPLRKDNGQFYIKFQNNWRTRIKDIQKHTQKWWTLKWWHLLQRILCLCMVTLFALIARYLFAHLHYLLW